MTNTVKIGFDAADMVEAIRRHHPAYNGPSGMQWVTLSEWCRIDLLAIECWQKARVIGYEVKVSRSDMRAELLRPAKRAEAVSRTTQFYFAVPTGMLKPEEVAFEDHGWYIADYERVPCPGVPKHQLGWTPHSRLGAIGGRCSNPRHDANGKVKQSRSRWVPKGTPKGFTVRLPVPAILKPTSFRTSFGNKIQQVYDEWSIADAVERQGYPRVICPTCGGSGYSELSKVELEAPTLWVPHDCGLVEVGTNGVKIVKLAPRRNIPKDILGRYPHRIDMSRVPLETVAQQQRHGLAQLVRHASAYQDPRHQGHR